MGPEPVGLLARLAAASLRLEALQQRPAYRLAGVVVGAAVLAPFLVTAPPDGVTVAAWRTAGVAATMALWWVGGVFPSAVTGLVPLVAFPLLGVAPLREAAAPYADPLVFLMVGGFVLGHGMERVGLHERLLATLLRPASLRSSPRRVLLALMLAAALLSAFVSNTASCVMLLPLALLLAERTGAPKGRAAFGLGLSFAVSIGGVATLIGTFPNAVLAKAARELGREVSFAEWMAVGVPFAVVALPIAWFVVSRLLLPSHGLAVERPAVPPWRPGERAVLAVVGLALVAWVTRNPIDLGPVAVPGWSAATGLGKHVDDAWVAMAAAAALFVLPAEGRPLLAFRDLEKAMPWGVMFLLGGGFALAETIESTGLSGWLAGPVSALWALPAPLAIAVVCALVTFTSELTSNTATCQLVLPLLVAGATAAGQDPLPFMIPATIAASCGFMMPVSTPPNAIVAEGAGVPPADMALAGLALDLALIAVATAVGLAVVPVVLG